MSSTHVRKIEAYLEILQESQLKRTFEDQELEQRRHDDVEPNPELHIGLVR